jgi:putative spermidine/putrescine transport system permease protein
MNKPDYEHGGWGLRLYGVLVALFLLLPIVIAAVLAFSDGERLQFPPPGISLRWFAAAINNAQFMDGLRRSVIIAIGSTVLATIAGTAAAIALNHYRFSGRSTIQALLMLPLALPGILIGLGLLFTLPMLNLQLGMLAAMLGHAVIGIPYVVAMVLAALSSFDRTLERASLNLGVGPIGTFFRITFPHIRLGVAAGAIATFLISLDNISLSLFITRGDTLPLRLMQHMLSYTDPSIAAMSTMLLFLSFLMLLILLPFVTRKRSA